MFIFDLHCDTLDKFYKNSRYNFKENGGHINQNSLILGGYMAQCFAIYLPPEIRDNDKYLFFKQQYNTFSKIIKESMALRQAKNKKELIKNIKNGKISGVLTVENADFLGGDLKKLKIAESLGVKFLGLIWNNENCLAHPNSIDKSEDELPLKSFGAKVIESLNCSNITADVSHLNSGGFDCVASISKKPFVATHSACKTIFNHPRNLSDSQIRKIAQSGGVVGINFYSRFLNGTNKTEISDIIMHLKHLIKVGGCECAAIGTDFDGIECELFLKNSGGMPIFVDALIKNFGFSTAEKICFKNAIRII